MYYILLLLERPLLVYFVPSTIGFITLSYFYEIGITYTL